MIQFDAFSFGRVGGSFWIDFLTVSLEYHHGSFLGIMKYEFEDRWHVNILWIFKF